MERESRNHADENRENRDPDSSRINPDRIGRLEEVVAAVSRPLPDASGEDGRPAGASGSGDAGSGDAGRDGGTVAAGSASEYAMAAESPATGAASASPADDGVVSPSPRPEIKDLYLRYQEELISVTPHELLDIFHRRLEAGLSASEILADLGKTLNLMFRGLKGYRWTRPPENSFGGVLMQENAALLSRLDEIRALLKDGALESEWADLGNRLLDLEQFNAHYLKKENILFPYLERKAEYFKGLAIMWALHDQIRDLFREIHELLAAEPQAAKPQDTAQQPSGPQPSGQQDAAQQPSGPQDAAQPSGQQDARAGLANLVGHLFFAMHGLVFKEELILLPAAMDVLSPEEWEAMDRQADEYGYPFIPPPERVSSAAGGSAEALDSGPGSRACDGLPSGGTGVPFAASRSGPAAPAAEARFCTSTGELDLDQLASVFDALPVDLTVVDEFNKVRYFTRPKDRIFPRSPAIVGRDVKNCHPPESVGKVLEIVEAFRAGRRDSATFWIRMRGRLILIRYFPLRDSQGGYKGTLEVSQDITDIQGLEGEQRLAQWD